MIIPNVFNQFMIHFARKRTDVTNKVVFIISIAPIVVTIVMCPTTGLGMRPNLPLPARGAGFKAQRAGRVACSGLKSGNPARPTAHAGYREDEFRGSVATLGRKLGGHNTAAPVGTRTAARGARPSPFPCPDGEAPIEGRCAHWGGGGVNPLVPSH